ncbi:MAG: hypothetical protein FJY65_08995, partial [Calditrichaeota bacterium]|nr:hypothetical protein [Calditrichota bacterium]
MSICKIPFTLVLVISMILTCRISTAEISIEPYGYFYSLESSDTLETTLSLNNLNQDEASFKISYRLIDYQLSDDERRGPQRDSPGDTLRQVQVPYYNTVGMAYDPQNNWIWGLAWTDRRLYALNLANDQIVVNVAVNQSILGMFYLNGVLYCGGYNNNPNIIFRYDLQGRALDNLRCPYNLTWTDIGGDDRYIYCITYPNGNGRGIVHVLDMQNNLQEVGAIDCSQWIGEEGWGIEIIPAHSHGWLWLSDRPNMYQFSVDDEWNADLIQTFRTVNTGHTGLAHDGVNLWRGTYDGATRIWYVIDDGVPENLEFNFNPASGIIAAGEEAVIEVGIISEECEAGVYNGLFCLKIDENPRQPNEGELTIEVGAVVSIDLETASIAGTVIDPAIRQPIENALVSLDHYLCLRCTNEEGMYDFIDLPLGEYILTFTATDYLPHTEPINVERAGEVELNVAMLHATCTPNVEELFMQLEPGGETDMDFSIANNGNGPLAYRVERRLLGEANAAPWELRRNYAVGNLLNDDRIEGVAFDGDNFFVSGAAGQNPNTIYVVNREGERVRQFIQPGESNYGMKDLEWDGELLWGSGEQRVFGFDREGQVQIQFQGPFNPNQAIAFDPVNNLLWVCATTNNIVGYDRQGQALGRVLNRRGMRIYGLAYWQDDPQGYPLYILHSPAQNELWVHKMRVDNGDTLRVRQLPVVGSPGGAFITNTFDVYSWVFMSISNIPRG